MNPDSCRDRNSKSTIMRYATIKPPIHLQPYIRCFWTLEHDFGENETNYVYRSVADGCVEMVFHYRAAFNELIDSGQPHNWLAGVHFQSDSFRRFETKESFGIFGAYIYPFTIPYLFNISSATTTNEMTDLNTLLGADGSRLEEQMMLASCNNERVAILTAFFGQRLQHAKTKDPTIASAIKHVIHSAQTDTVEQLASRFNLSTRQFNRKFKEYAGFSPKMYMRLTRLTNAIKQGRNEKSLSYVAHECGYYDQSHFIHEVKLFTGYHPGFYFSGKAEGTEWLYL